MLKCIRLGITVLKIVVWTASWQNQQDGCAPSEDSDQPGHTPSLIRVFAVCLKKAWVLSYLLSAQWRLSSDWADARLIWVFAGCTVILLVLSCHGSFGEINCCFYGHKLRSTTPLARQRKTKFLSIKPTFYLSKWQFWRVIPENVSKFLPEGNGLTCFSFVVLAIISQLNEIHHFYRVQLRPKVMIWT